MNSFFCLVLLLVGSAGVEGSSEAQQLNRVDLLNISDSGEVLPDQPSLLPWNIQEFWNMLEKFAEKRRIEADYERWLRDFELWQDWQKRP